MRRRGFLAALMSLPVLRWFKPKKTVGTIEHYAQEDVKQTDAARKNFKNVLGVMEDCKAKGWKAPPFHSQESWMEVAGVDPGIGDDKSVFSVYNVNEDGTFSFDRELTAEEVAEIYKKGPPFTNRDMVGFSKITGKKA
jgi:hypothetical protein